MANSKSHEKDEGSNQQNVQKAQKGLQDLIEKLPPGLAREVIEICSKFLDKATQIALPNTEANDLQLAGETPKRGAESQAADSPKKKARYVSRRGAVLDKEAKNTYETLNGTYERLNELLATDPHRRDEIKLAMTTLDQCAKVVGDCLNTAYKSMDVSQKIEPQERAKQTRHNQPKTTIRRVATPTEANELNNAQIKKPKQKGKSR